MKVWDRRDPAVPAGAIDITRGGPWGNPYAIRPGRTRKQAVQMFREHVAERPWLQEAIRRELRGRDLVCCCAPKECHGDVYVEVCETVASDKDYDREALIPGMHDSGEKWKR